jgi:hypothetical protein
MYRRDHQRRGFGILVLAYRFVGTGRRDKKLLAELPNRPGDTSRLYGLWSNMYTVGTGRENMNKLIILPIGSLSVRIRTLGLTSQVVMLCTGAFRMCRFARWCVVAPGRPDARVRF